MSQQANQANWIPIEPYWAIEEAYALAAAEVLSTLDLSARRARSDDDSDPDADKPYQVKDGVALFALNGPLTKQMTCATWWFGGTSTARFRQELRQAARDPEVKAILIDVDSPGGTVAGTSDLADDVYRIAQVKPVYGYISDMACSAALWIVSQASAVYANPTAIIGSIGVVSVVQDKSRMYENAGIKVHVISTSAFKGAGATGTPITKEQLSEMQRTIDSIQEEFIGTVARGRRMDAEAVRLLADGRLHVGREAVDLGLVDAIAPIDTIFTRLAAQPAIAIRAAFEDGQNGDHTMSKANLWQQLRSALGGAEEPGTDTEPAAPASTAAPPDNSSSAEIAALRAEIAALKSEAAYGREAISALRSDAKAQAVRAYGAKLGSNIGSAVDSLDAATVAEMRDAWRAEADAKYGIGASGEAARRITAPAAAPRLAAMAEEDRPDAKGGWESLSDEQKRLARTMFPGRVQTADDRNELARYILNPNATPKALSGFEE